MNQAVVTYRRPQKKGLSYPQTCDGPTVTALATEIRKRIRYIAFSILLVASVPLWWPSIHATVELALSSDAYTHILLILPLIIALIVFDTSHSPVTSARNGWVVGAVLLGIALCLQGLAAWNVCHLSSGASLSSSMLALVLWWIGSVITCYGLPTFRSLFFPLCFLLLIVPLPGRVVETAREFLQHQSAVASEILFRATRVPVTREGIMLSIPSLDIEVARECSSIRSSTMLVVITLILAHLFLRSLWRKVLLILIAIPLSVAKNAVRIFTIAELGTRVDSSYLNGKLHHNGGIVFLSFALIVDIGLLWILRKNESRIPSSPGVSSECKDKE